jgi:hypothetical protein
MNSLKRQSKLERTNRPTIENGEDHAQKPQIIPRTVMVDGLTMCINNSHLVGQLRLRLKLRSNCFGVWFRVITVS